MSTYPSLDAYNADILAAREAYRADREVEAGFCESGCGRKRDGHGRNAHRRCWTCRHPNARDA